MSGKIKKGSIFASSWGYEQSNVEFYEVVKVTAKTVVVKMIASSYEPTAWCQGSVMPKPGQFRDCPWFDDRQNAEGKRCTVKDYGEPYININDRIGAWLWDGRSKRVTSYA